MIQTLPGRGVTFAVDDVTPAAAPLTQVRTHEALRARLGDLESCHDYHGQVVADVYGHPLLEAVHLAFSQHRPLVLSPDAVWITIAQGVAHHMALHGERLRSRFVAHQGRIDLRFTCRGWVAGSPENPWAEAFAGWAGQIREHVGPIAHDALVCDFSTTGPAERAASHVVMMDVFERYFRYEAYCICGIPTVTLTGTPADWRRLAEKAAALRVFELDWWLEHLLPICEQFVRASEGHVNRKHWRAICKLRQAYGGDVINGWVAKLFPYLKAFIAGPCTLRNPIFETGEGFQALHSPPSWSRVLFTWTDATTGRSRLMEAVGGLIGVGQDGQTLALEPRAGWAVHAASKLEVLLARIAAKHTTYPGAQVAPKTPLPPHLGTFYHRTDGAELFGGAVRIVPLAEVEPLEWGERRQKWQSPDTPLFRTWRAFARLADGTRLAINVDRGSGCPWADDPVNQKQMWKLSDRFAPICHVRRQGVAGENPVVALTFTEWLGRVLNHGGRPYWQEPGFTVYGDAEAFMARTSG